MSILGDLFAGIKLVATLDERIVRVETNVAQLRPAISRLGNRLTRVETILEMVLPIQRRLDRD